MGIIRKPYTNWLYLFDYFYPYRATTMIHYENSIDIQKPRELVFNFLTLPSNWAEYWPTTIAVTPVISRNFNVGVRVTETLNILGSKTDIQWTCKKNDSLSFYEIEGISQKHGGSTTLLSYEFSGQNGITRIKRVISHRFDKLRMRILDPIWKIYFMYEANVAFKRAKQILESLTDDSINKRT